MQVSRQERKEVLQWVSGDIHQLEFVCTGMNPTTGKNLAMKDFGVCNARESVKMEERLTLITAMITMIDSSSKFCLICRIV